MKKSVFICLVHGFATSFIHEILTRENRLYKKKKKNTMKNDEENIMKKNNINSNKNTILYITRLDCQS